MPKFNTGEKVRIKWDVSKNGRYSHVAGEKAVIEDYYGNGSYRIEIEKTGESMPWVSGQVLEKLDENVSERKEIEEKIQFLEKEKRELEMQIWNEKEKLKFMDFLGIDTFDSTDFKAYLTIKTLGEEDKLTPDYVKKVSKIMKSS